MLSRVVQQFQGQEARTPGAAASMRESETLMAWSWSSPKVRVKRRSKAPNKQMLRASIGLNLRLRKVLAGD
jgi:hypothetical protein